MSSLWDGQLQWSASYQAHYYRSWPHSYTGHWLMLMYSIIRAEVAVYWLTVVLPHEWAAAVHCGVCMWCYFAICLSLFLLPLANMRCDGCADLCACKHDEWEKPWMDSCERNLKILWKILMKFCGWTFSHSRTTRLTLELMRIVDISGSVFFEKNFSTLKQNLVEIPSPCSYKSSHSILFRVLL